jgi:hypothetical protein
VSTLLIRILVVLVAAPLWWPVAKLLWHAVRDAAEDRELPPAAPSVPRGRTRREVWSRADEPWSKRRWVNAGWDTGRRGARGAFGRSAPPASARGRGLRAP